MTGLLRPRRLLTIATIAAVWCGLWREISAANAISGIAVAIVITATRAGTPGTGGIRPIPLLKLMRLVLVDLIRSTINVAGEILTPTDHTNEAIIATDVSFEGRDHLLLLVVAITLTPGTAVVDADPDTGTLYLHLLHHDRRREAITHVERLSRLAAEALPTPTTGITA